MFFYIIHLDIFTVWLKSKYEYKAKSKTWI